MDLVGELERGFATAIYPNRVAIAIAAVLALVVLAIVGRRHRWDLAVRRYPKAYGSVLVTVLVVALPVGWYLGSPLFLSTTLDEPPPTAASVSSSQQPQATAGDSSSRPTEGQIPTATEPASPPATAAVVASSSPTPAVVLARSGRFHGADDFHFGLGTARLIETATGQFVVRLEDFAVRNGPDLFVYLSPDPDGYTRHAVELGRLKADRGAQNYPVPAGFDPSRAASVVIWCRQFSVLFAIAALD